MGRCCSPRCPCRVCHGPARGVATLVGWLTVGGFSSWSLMALIPPAPGRGGDNIDERQAAQGITVRHQSSLLRSGLTFAFISILSLPLPCPGPRRRPPESGSEKRLKRPGEIRFQFVQLNQGVVRCALYATRRLHRRILPLSPWALVSGAAPSASFPHHPGTYSMAAFLTKNNNDKLDTGTFGIPVEILYLEQRQRDAGSPKYKAAAFDFSGGTLTKNCG